MGRVNQKNSKKILSKKCRIEDMILVRLRGLEPRRLSTYAPQTYVSTNSTTSALEET